MFSFYIPWPRQKQWQARQLVPHRLSNELLVAVGSA
jgi:hypothetical protein